MREIQGWRDNDRVKKAWGRKCNMRERNWTAEKIAKFGTMKGGED